MIRNTGASTSTSYRSIVGLMALTRPTILVGVTQIYRDCMKIASRISDDQVRITALRRVLKGEFAKNRGVTDPDKLEELRGK